MLPICTRRAATTTACSVLARASVAQLSRPPGSPHDERPRHRAGRSRRRQVASEQGPPDGRPAAHPEVPLRRHLRPPSCATATTRPCSRRRPCRTSTSRAPANSTAARATTSTRRRSRRTTRAEAPAPPQGADDEDAVQPRGGERGAGRGATDRGPVRSAPRAHELIAHKTRNYFALGAALALVAAPPRREPAREGVEHRPLLLRRARPAAAPRGRGRRARGAPGAIARR